LAPNKEKVVSEGNWKKTQLKLVQKAFSNNDEQRYGVMLNAIEFALVKKGLNLELVRLSVLEKPFGRELAEQIIALIEQCNMAQYAPSAVSNDSNNLKTFVDVWEKI
jgi:hypothetical protein